MLVGRGGALVRVGCGGLVGGNRIGVALGPVMGMNVSPKEEDGVGVNVQVVVGVKRIVGMGVGEAKTVAVNPVEVGNGFKSACAVFAMAVLVLAAFCISTSLAGPRELIQITSIKAINRPVAPSACR